ncbi:staphylococcal nuclease, partial [Rozella allomycis CSF55]
MQNKKDLNELFQPLLFVGCGSLLTICSYILYQRGFRKYSSPDLIPRFMYGKYLFGHIVEACDSDNVRFKHIPLFRILGNKNVEYQNKKLMYKNTMNIRLAGIDAPEMSHFGKTAQPFSKEAMEFLNKLTKDRYAIIKPLRLDRYSRLVAMVYVRKGLIIKNVSLDMIRAGYATIYSGIDAEYDGKLNKFKKCEAKA